MSTRLAIPLGDVDGNNDVFTTPTSYAPASLVVSVDDVLLSPDDVVFTDPTAGVFTLADAPFLDSVVRVAYTDPVEDATGQRPAAAIVDRLADLHLEGGNDLSIVAGESGRLIRFTILDRDGARADLTGCIVYWKARITSETGTSAFDKTSLDPSVLEILDQTTAAGTGIAEVIFTEEETLLQSNKILVWDLWVRTPSPGDVLICLMQGARLQVRAGVRSVFPE